MSKATATKSTLPIPSFFDPKTVGDVWKVNYEDRAVDALAWADAHGLGASLDDATRVSLLLVDVQNTFCIPGYELFVDGAVEDNVRLAEFIYGNLDVISSIAPTMDTHTAMQIFHSIFLCDADGNLPTPGTQITVEDVKTGVWRVNPAISGLVGGKYTALQKHLLHYTDSLDKAGKYSLMVWPYHAMLGGIGHALVSSIEEACFFHNVARRSQTDFQIKGGNPLTENYSVLRPEVLTRSNGTALAQRNSNFIERLLNFDAVIIAGQAKSHCVAWTIDDLLTEINSVDPELAKKVYLLEDCTSPVVIPGVYDFTADADSAFERFSDAGMHVVKSTDPIENWADFPTS